MNYALTLKIYLNMYNLTKVPNRRVKNTTKKHGDFRL